MMVSEDLLDRAARAERNHALFRGANERVKGLNESFDLVVPDGEWICECACETCIDLIEMSVDEYEAVHRYGARFFVAPTDAHFWPDVERVLEHHDRYWVVEKVGAGSSATERHDPRRGRQPLPLRT